MRPGGNSGGGVTPPVFSNGTGQIVSLPIPGVPRNLPPALLLPLNAGTSRKASNMPITDPGYIYHDKSQETGYISTGSKEVDALIIGAARTHGVNPNMLKAQFWQESKFKNGATSGKGAAGVAQLMPGTAARVGITNTRDAAQSIYGGAKYMRYQADFMASKGNIIDGKHLRATSLAGYNAGEGAVQTRGFTIPKFAETEGYVQKITRVIDTAPQTTKTATQIKQDLSKLSRPEAEVYGKAYGNLYGAAKGLERNRLDNEVSGVITRQSYTQQRDIAAANLQMQYQILDNKAQNQMQSVTTDLNYGRMSADTRLETKEQVAAVNRATVYRSAQLQYEGTTGQAAFQYEGTKAAANITKEAALDNLYKRNMSSLVQSVGGSISHQLSELFERASRGL